jgi:hypothetical protein
MEIIKKLRQIYLFFRWQIKPARKLTKAIFMMTRHKKKTTSSGSQCDAKNVYSKNLNTLGYTTIQENIVLPAVQINKFQGQSDNLSFVNVAKEEWQTVQNLLVDVLTNEKLSSTIRAYFDGNPWLWNVALNYSEANNRITDSQLWHFDYGDTRQLHLMAYFSDVDLNSGPFTFFNAIDSDKVDRNPWTIERFADEDLSTKYGIDVHSQAIRLTGSAGELFLADPGRLLHQGARCNKPRLVLFATFTSVAPMSLGGTRTLRPDQREDLYKAYQAKVSAPFFTKEFFF